TSGFYSHSQYQLLTTNLVDFSEYGIWSCSLVVLDSLMACQISSRIGGLARDPLSGNLVIESVLFNESRK
uniref:Uncharacterized protein n=1 Tax=Crocodylus porosus TaxID=8502 RepID=A0A7M4F0L3_CROPO